MSDRNSSRLEQHFGTFASNYAQDPIQKHDFTIDRIHTLIEPKPDDRLLDVACGAGHTAMSLASSVHSVVGLDAVTAMLDVAEQEAKKRGIENIEWMQGDALSIPLADSSVSKVTCRLAAHHFEDPAKFFAEAYRVLEPGGGSFLCLVDSHLPEEVQDEINAIQKLHDQSHVGCLSRAEFERLAVDAGFTIRVVEEGRVELRLSDWLARSAATDAEKEYIRHLLTVDASPAAQALLDVQQLSDDDLIFHFQRIVILAEALKG